MRESQLLRKQLPAALLPGGLREMAPRCVQRAQVPLASQKYRFTGGRPAGGAENCLAQFVQAGTCPGGDGDGSRGRREGRAQIQLVVNVDPSYAGRNAIGQL